MNSEQTVRSPKGCSVGNDRCFYKNTSKEKTEEEDKKRVKSKDSDSASNEVRNWRWTRIPPGSPTGHLEDEDYLNEAIVSPPTSNTRRWRHKRHYQTIVGKRYQIGTPTQVLTPDAMEADMRRISIRDSLKSILDCVDKPSL